ncbi:hypothetical protein GJ700_09735 [Duganella sp. FT92W]|uniref:Aspartyl/asparaginy/proline hydroxylase domain-containing protein n=1 Tax=Pseudoduganella rivuli TaxID=2666085 RepID=A0A7X2ILZ2_9BURK|nr:aspartyl/asparaginyl beta-hydroxylase domain-containing protein [Pseudoduganella rivuli]MRV71992.1 hypothetical protein [Pseudoduganella rivuli]
MRLKEKLINWGYQNYFKLAHALLVRNSTMAGKTCWRGDEVPWLHELEENYQVVLEETMAFKRHIGRHLDKEDLYPGMTRHHGLDKWEYFHSMVYCQRIEPVAAHFPKTLALVKDVLPNACSVMVSCMPGVTNIPRHEDFKTGTLRVHLGLKVPDPVNDFLVFDDIKLNWAEGKAFVIDQTRAHAVVKPSTEERIVLLVDFPRPAGRFFEWLNYDMFVKVRGAFEGAALSKRYQRVLEVR